MLKIVSKVCQVCYSPSCNYSVYFSLFFFQIDLILNFEELLESLGIRHRFVIKESTDNYPNVPATLLPEWCKKGTDDVGLIYFAKIHNVQTRMGKWYSRLWITDEYSISGVKVSEAIKPPPVSTSLVMLWSARSMDILLL